MRRLGAALAVVAAPVVITVPLVLSWRDRLPAQLAVHWTTGDQPDGFMGRDGFLDGWSVASVAALAIGIGVILLMRRGRRTGVTLLGVVTGFLAALGLMVALPNLDVTDALSARITWEAALPLAVMAGIAGLAWLVYGRPDDPLVPATSKPPADLPRLDDGERPHHDESGTQWILAVFTLGLLGALGVLMWVVISPWLGVELIIAGAVLATFGWVRVRVPENDEIVLSGGPIRYKVPIAEVTGARVRDEVNPMSEFGGWGLRYVPGTVALVHRRGPGVEVSRTDDRSVVVTTDEPEHLAAVINTLADKQHT